VNGIDTGRISSDGVTECKRLGIANGQAVGEGRLRGLRCANEKQPEK
jgi:hypothetical protein